MNYIFNVFLKNKLIDPDKKMSFAAFTHKTDLQIATTLIKRIHFESTKTL